MKYVSKIWVQIETDSKSDWALAFESLKTIAIAVVGAHAMVNAVLDLDGYLMQFTVPTEKEALVELTMKQALNMAPYPYGVEVSKPIEQQ